MFENYCDLFEVN